MPFSGQFCSAHVPVQRASGLLVQGMLRRTRAVAERYLEVLVLLKGGGVLFGAVPELSLVALEHVRHNPNQGRSQP